MGESSGAHGPDLTRGVQVADIPDGGVLEGQVKGEAVLLYRDGAAVTAVGATCTHYGGPLAKGLIENGRAHCPWHQACFDLRTGEAIKAPAFADLPSWKVEIRGGRAFVKGRAPKLAPVPPLKSEVERIVILGGGAAGFAAAERLRGLGYDGRLTLISADVSAPYDRPNLSKDYLAGTAPAEWMPLKGEAWYAENRIELRLGVTARMIDRKERCIGLSHRDEIDYDRLLLATGAKPVLLDGFAGPQVRSLRSMADAQDIINLSEAARSVVIIGAGFIGLEAAAALRHRGLKVHVVTPDTAPMERVLGPELAALVVDLHRQKGVQFHLGRKPASFDGAAVTLDDGARLEAQLVVVGVGVKPRSEIAEASGLSVDNGVMVDALLRTSDPNIFAAGDVARYPDPITGEPARVEHWVHAERMGQAAAANMLGADTPFTDAPFFWSNHYDLSIHYVGQGRGWDSSRVEGDLAGGRAVVKYLKGDRMIAAATIGRSRESLRLAMELEGAS